MRNYPALGPHPLYIACIFIMTDHVTRRETSEVIFRLTAVIEMFHIIQYIEEIAYCGFYTVI